MSAPQEKVMEDEKKSISLNDLASLRNIVNVASRRGAFGAEEFEDVGKVYSKLDNFLKEQGKILEEQAASAKEEGGGSIEGGAPVDN
tara:strand:- start:63 stop:323 length:261 start_codon:yes stop_codon:yes gene_type:complete